jgi:hypothetical protein
MKGAHGRAGQKAAASALRRQTEGNRLEDWRCETLLRHEGLAPVRFKLDTGSGCSKRTHSCRTSDRSPCLFPAPRTSGPWRGSLSHNQARGRQVGANGVQAFRDRNGASPSLAREDRRTKRRQKERQTADGEQASAYAPAAAFDAGNGPNRKGSAPPVLASSRGTRRSIASRRACPELAEGMVQSGLSVAQAGPSFETPRCAWLLRTRAVKKGRGGRHNPLKRLGSAKEMEGFNLDFLPVFLGFPSARAWIPFRGIWKSFIALARRQKRRRLQRKGFRFTQHAWRGTPACASRRPGAQGFG